MHLNKARNDDSIKRKAGIVAEILHYMVAVQVYMF